MRVADVFIEHSSIKLNTVFTYLCPQNNVQKGVRVQVPFRNQTIVGFVNRVYDTNETFAYPLKSILSVLDEEALLNKELFQLAGWMSEYYLAPMISCFQAMLPSKLKPKTTKQKVIMQRFVRLDKNIEKPTKRQQEVLSEINQQQEMSYTEFLKKYKTVGKKLIELGACVEFEKEQEASFAEYDNLEKPFTLTADQNNAIKKIEPLQEHGIVLLHGTTGSGKTEVFLQLAQKVLDDHKQVLILVPEIALTPLMEKRVKNRFGSQVAMYHSGLNNQEKYEQYQLVKNKRVNIVIGTRSAVMMPFYDLGLIVLDEEHDLSYKQDSIPKYHCRDVAIQRAIHHNCKLVLASATPSLESYARAYKGVYQLVEMPDRIQQNEPTVHFVNMAKAIRKGEHPYISKALSQAIQKRLAHQEQVILLLNKRGYHSILRCLSCGYVQMCPHCDVAMSYHKHEHILKCHICGYMMPVLNECPTCHEHDFRFLGIGTERLESFLNQLFPESKVLRMDADTTSKKGAHARILNAFENHEADILIGTQMIAKGLDFPNVTLVGILNSDAGLLRNDYRSTELCYDLLAQACGRSGRAQKAGEVIMQTYDSSHYALRCAANHNYFQFFKQEMQYRHLAGYPPYQYLGSIVFSDVDEHKVIQAADIVNDIAIDQQIKMLGPAKIMRINGKHRIRYVLKTKNEELLHQTLKRIQDVYIATKKHAKIEVDCDPLTLSE